MTLYDLIDLIKSIVPILKTYGLTKSQLTPLGLTTAVVFVVYYILVYKPFKATLDNFKEVAGDLHNASREMQIHLKKSKRFTPIHELPHKPAWSQMNSPMVLNERGQKLFEQSGMSELLLKNESILVAKLEEVKLSTAYDVQNQAYIVLGDFLASDNELVKRVKDFLYNHPQFEDQPVGLDDIVYVGMIKLRDAYIKKHPELIDTTFGDDD